MPYSPEQRQRVLDALASRRLRLELPKGMFAGRGTGRTCDGCGDSIGPTQVEYECVYHDGFSHFLHLGCAGLLDAEQRRVMKIQEQSEQDRAVRENARRIREEAQEVRDDARGTAKASAQIRDRADVISTEAQLARAEARKVKRGERSPDVLAPSLPGSRILLVDDHDDTREVFTRILRMAGALVLDAATALDALPLVAMCDVVVTDLAMSGRDGLWLLEQIEAGTHRVPVIAITAYSGDFELERAAGRFARVIRKPVEPAELPGVIRAVLRR
jgi:CheY-like chemotaxis protein